ncbi:MAG: phosphotransferase family protein [Candidatus Heimdallarchaeota archaeon]
MVFFEETNPRDIPLDVVKTALRVFFPAITSEEIKFFYHGTYNVFEVKLEYIFRFPDQSLFNQKGFDLIQRERQLLDLLRPYISVNIPQFLHISSDPKTPFVGYRKIPGKSLSQCVKKATSEQKKELAKQIGCFLSELHSPTFYKIFTTKWPSNFSPDTYRAYWMNFYEAVRERIYPRFSFSQKDWVTNLFSAFLEDKHNFRFIPRITHCDFDTSNILVDPTAFHLTGIIDFEDTRVWDPAGDFLFHDEALNSLNELLSYYTHPLGTNFEQRMNFLRKRSPLTYLLTGIDLNYPRMVDAGFEMLKQEMEVA